MCWYENNASIIFVVQVTSKHTNNKATVEDSILSYKLLHAQEAEFMGATDLRTYLFLDSSLFTDEGDRYTYTIVP